jgi:hypothetical protein
MGEGKAVEITEEGERQGGQTKVLVESNLGTIGRFGVKTETQLGDLWVAANTFVQEQL